jgi:hypothetical protein
MVHNRSTTTGVQLGRRTAYRYIEMVEEFNVQRSISQFGMIWSQHHSDTKYCPTASGLLNILVQTSAMAFVIVTAITQAVWSLSTQIFSTRPPRAAILIECVWSALPLLVATERPFSLGHPQPNSIPIPCWRKNGDLASD